jgi:cytoskeletal protein RodZ
MDPIVWIVIAVVAVLVVGALVWVAMNKRRTEQLREQFGPEYDRTVEQTGDRRDAESELAERRARREDLDIRPLDAATRQRYAEQWRDVQARFVDEPAAALTQANGLVIMVMRDRGYPTDDFEQRAADVSVDHPQVVENYRAANTISERVGSDRASTEDMRQGLVYYRSLFAELLDESDEGTVQQAR